MDKKLILAGGIVIIIAVIAAIVFSTNKPNDQVQGAQEAAEVTEEKSDESVSGSILSLLQGGKNVSCTYSIDTEGGNTSGTVYIAGEKMYGEFTTTANGQSFDSKVIRDGEYMYAWSSAVAGGTKMKIVESDGDTVETEKDETTKSLEQEVDFKCGRWTVDDSKFTPPSDIEFTDLSAALENADKMIQGVQDQSPENVCSSLPESVRQQCIDGLEDALNSAN